MDLLWMWRISSLPVANTYSVPIYNTASLVKCQNFQLHLPFDQHNVGLYLQLSLNLWGESLLASGPSLDVENFFPSRRKHIQRSNIQYGVSGPRAFHIGHSWMYPFNIIVSYSGQGPTGSLQFVYLGKFCVGEHLWRRLDCQQETHL